MPIAASELDWLTVSEFVRTPRNSMRYPVWLTANCRSSMGRLSDIILSDLSAEGCGVTTSEGLLKSGMLLVVRLKSLEGLAGTVVWVKGKRAGVKFERPLYGPVVEHLVRVQVAPPPQRYTSQLSSARRI